jgi:hypothetical protein
MKTLTKELWMNVPQRRAIVSIHRNVERLVAESGVRDGLALINAMHITASVFIKIMNQGCIATTINGSKSSRRSIRHPNGIITIGLVKIMRTLTTSDRSWAARS